MKKEVTRERFVFLDKPVRVRGGLLKDKTPFPRSDLNAKGLAWGYCCFDRIPLERVVKEKEKVTTVTRKGLNVFTTVKWIDRTDDLIKWKKTVPAILERDNQRKKKYLIERIETAKKELRDMEKELRKM